MSTSTFDPTPLTEPVDRTAVAAHRKELLAAGRLPSGGGVWVIVVVVAVFLFVGFFVVSIFVEVLTSSLSGANRNPLAFGFILVISIFAIGVVSLIIRGLKGSHERIYRLDRFARANGLTWYAEASAPPLPGMIFSHGHSRKSTDILRGERPRFVEFANYRYTTGSGKNQTTHRWGYVAIRLATPLPHIVLDATGNNGLFGSNLPQAFDKDQRLSLEGDFDEHFALYCPQGYEQDALYLFTPDIMARFIDHAAQLDVEIVDDWLFLYAKRDLSTLDPNTWAWLFSAVGALLDKLAQWERWRDDRLTQTAAVPGATADSLPFAPPLGTLRPPPGVAAQGRRLKGGVSWPAIIIGGLFVLGVFAMQSGLLDAIFR